MEKKADIIDKIKNDYNDQIKLVKEDALKKAKQITSLAQAEANDYVSAKEVEIKQDCMDNFRLKVAKFEFDKEREILKMKNSILDKLFEKVLQKLNSLNENQYYSLIDSLISKNAEDGDEIILAKNCKIKDDAVCKLKVFKDKNLHLSKNRGDFNGGLIISNTTRDIVCSFESLVAETRDKCVCDLAKSLLK